MRYFEFSSEDGFSLNGKPYEMRGVGRHQDYEGLGYATPVSTLVEDTRTIKTMGVNAMPSHYPHCEAVYSECDKSGLLVWAKFCDG